MRPGIPCGIAHGQNRKRQQDSRDDLPGGRASQAIGGGNHRHQPQRRAPEHPTEAARHAAVVAVFLRPHADQENEADDAYAQNQGSELAITAFAGSKPHACARQTDQPNRRQREHAMVADERVQSIHPFRLLAAIDTLAIEPIAFYFAPVHGVRVIVPVIRRVAIAAKRIRRGQPGVRDPIRAEERRGHDDDARREGQQRLPRSCATAVTAP